MRWDLAGRGAAIGVAVGVAAAVETVRGTPALHPAAAGLLPGLELASIFVATYAAAGAAVGIALGALGPLARIGAPRSLWSIAALAVAFAVWNEAARAHPALDAWRYLGRVVIAVAAALVAAHALLRSRDVARRVLAPERALAALLVPAAAGVALYAVRPFERGGRDAPADVTAFAPRFEPEPAGAFAHAHDPGRPRVLLVGVDGADWTRIERGVAAGRLPTFARLVADGVAAPLRSVEPTYSPRIWTSIVTGATADEHGVEDFYLLQLPRLGVESLQLRRSLGLARAVLERTGELRFVPVTSSLRRRKALWNLADEAGLRSAVVGLWATWPPEPLRHGMVVSDHASLARQREWLDRGKSSEGAQVTTWPVALARELAPLQRSPDSVTWAELAHFVALDAETWRAFGAVEEFSKDVPLSAFRSSHLNDAFHARAAEKLWREERPDLLVVYLRAIDELSHFFYEAGVPEAASLGWSDADARRFGGVVDAAYEATDRALAALVGEALAEPDVLVVLVSDHGWEREADGRYDHNEAPPGVLVLAGAGVCRGACPPLGDPSIYDVAPTLLERMGLPLAADLPGRPLREAFATPAATTAVARYGARLGASHAVASKQDEQMREKLEALGYVER
jgi:hypothetical protein